MNGRRLNAEPFTVSTDATGATDSSEYASKHYLEEKAMKFLTALFNMA